MSRQLTKPRNLIIALLLLLLAAIGYGYAATNTLDATGAGDGANTISGYAISNILYTLDDLNPGLLDILEFDIAPIEAGAPAAVTVQVFLAGSWTTCTVDAGVATCDFSLSPLDLDGVNMDNLRIVATSN